MDGIQRRAYLKVSTGAINAKEVGHRVWCLALLRMTKRCCETMQQVIVEGIIDENVDGDSVNVNGCCGGGCYVLTRLVYCPYCGTK